MFGFSWKLLNRCRNKERSSASAIKERETQSCSVCSPLWSKVTLKDNTACMCAAPLTWWGHAVLIKQKALMYRHKSPTSNPLHLILNKNTAIKTKMELKNQTQSEATTDLSNRWGEERIKEAGKAERKETKTRKRGERGWEGRRTKIVLRVIFL